MVPEPHRRPPLADRASTGGVFTRFVADHRAPLERLVATRTTQTNEVGRCAVPAPCARADRRRGRTGRASRRGGEWGPQPAPRSVPVPLPRRGWRHDDRRRGLTRRHHLRHPRRRTDPDDPARPSLVAAGSTGTRSMSPIRPRPTGWRPASGPIRPTASTGWCRRSNSHDSNRRNCWPATRSRRWHRRSSGSALTPIRS